MTPTELARVLRAGHAAATDPVKRAIEAMIAECDAIERETRHAAQPTFTPGLQYATENLAPPPAGPYAEHQATPNGKFHRVLVYFAGDVEQAKHFERWFNRGDWAKYESWYQSLAAVAAPEGNGRHRAPAPAPDEPDWPVLPPPDLSAPPSTAPFEAPVTEPLRLAPSGPGPSSLAAIFPDAARTLQAARARVYHEAKVTPDSPDTCTECDGDVDADQHQLSGDPGKPPGGVAG
jgi:hypothetical protein